MSTVVVDSYSDVFMPCPPDVENGRKEALVERFGKAERMLSDPRTGECSFGTFDVDLIDDGRFRQQLASFDDRYWSRPLTVKMTSRANRAVKGTWYTVWNGPIVDYQVVRPKGLRLKLGDRISSQIITNHSELPFRRVGDGFLDQLIAVSENLDRKTPEPRIYGKHKRVPDVDLPSPEGFCVLPTYLGTIDIGGIAYHVWMLAGHACADVPTIRVDGVEKIADEGSQWLVPHHAAHDAQFGAPYCDFVSSTYGDTRRYSLIFGLVTDPFADLNTMTDPDACALGHRQLTVAVDGVEPVGDGSGEVITDRIQCYKHWKINDVAHSGRDSYMSGTWLTNPPWDAFGVTVGMIDEESYDRGSAIAALRMPATEDTEAGYPCAAIIGATSGDVASVATITAKWNRSCGGMSGTTRQGRDRFVMLSPTATDKAAAPLYTDVNHILRNSFEVEIRRGEQTNALPYQGDLNQATGVFMTTGTATWQESIDNYEETIESEPIDYPFAPGETALFHLARIEVLRAMHPPRRVTIQAPIGPDKNADSLAYRELGDYFRYKAFPAVANAPDEIRLAQIVKIQVQVGDRSVLAEGVDCEDLIGLGGGESYDRPEVT